MPVQFIRSGNGLRLSYALSELGQISSFGEVIGEVAFEGMTIGPSNCYDSPVRRQSVVWLEIATSSGHRVHTKRGGASLHRGRIDRSKVLSPFQEICTPIHRRMNDDRRMTTSIAASPSNAAILSAKR